MLTSVGLRPPSVSKAGRVQNNLKITRICRLRWAHFPPYCCHYPIWGYPTFDLAVALYDIFMPRLNWFFHAYLAANKN